MQLKSTSGDIIKVNREVMKISTLLYEMSQDDTQDTEEISLPFETPLIKKIIEFCNQNQQEPLILKNCMPLPSTDMYKMVPKWYADFVNITDESVFELMKAANYLLIDSLTDLTCMKIASQLKDKLPEEIRKILGIEDYISKEESGELILAHNWNKTSDE